MHRSDIIQAATLLFSQKGYYGTSMKDIARAVHLREASLYHHVTSKQEILLNVLDQELDSISSDVYAVADSALSPEEKLRSAMQVYIGRLSQDINLSTLLLLGYRNLEPRLRAQHIEHRDRFEQVWRHIIREGIKKGIFREVDVSMATFAILGIQNWMVAWYREDGPMKTLELADRFSDFILRGLRIDR